MSRVEQARQRAAELRGQAVQEEVELEMAPSADVVSLAGEPFPLEMPDRRPRRQATRPDAEALAPVMAEARRPAPVLPETTGPGSLFERIDGSLAEKVVIDSNMEPSSREQYRRLAAALHHAQAATGLKVVMIASAVPGEGKTLTASNLALTLSESYLRSVLLVDADLRRPTLHTIFRIDNSAGLTDGLMSVTEHRLAVRQVSQGLAVLPAGLPSADPMSCLTSQRMRRLLDEARETFDWIIIDTPPVALLPDANLLASMVDGAVLVVRAGSTPYAMVNRAIEAVGRERILGTVLNQAETESHEYTYPQYGRYYSPRNVLSIKT